MRFLFAFALIQTAFSVCCIECDSDDDYSTNCTQCNYGFKLVSNICLNNCPSMYDSLDTGACSPQGSTQIILTNFNQYSSFNTDTAGDFKPTVDDDFSGLNSLTPTLDRGFYCSPSKSIKSEILLKYAPDLTINLYILPVQDGQILELQGAAEISYFSSQICINLGVMDQLYILETFISMCAGLDQEEWARVNFKISQATVESIQVEIWSNDVSIGLNTYNFFEASRSDPVEGLTYLGDKNLLTSYTGFIYSVSVYNSLTSDTLSASTIPTCSFLQLSINGECFDCDPNCGTDFQCRFPDSCITCSFTNCQTCTGYSTADCKQCDNGEDPPYCCERLCKTCTSLYICSVCQPGKVLIENLCLYDQPYRVTGSVLPTNSIYSVLFDSYDFGSYPGWISGQNPLTYYHYGNGEPDDPIPFKNRGLYFDGVSKYLEYDSEVLLAHKNIVVFLIKSISTSPCQTLFNLGTALKILNCGQLAFTTEDYEGLSTLYPVNILTVRSNWHFLIVRISTVDFDTTVTVYHDLSQITQRTISQSAFRMLSSTMVLGKGDDMFFHGFLYSFEIFQTDQNTVSSTFTVCENQLDSNCVNLCGPNEFLSSFTCSSCLDSCSEGCKDTQDCSLCSASYCLECLNFEPSSCTNCKTNFVLNGSDCVCLGVIKNNECKSCHSHCASCSDVYANSCLSCFGPKIYLLSGICVGICPSGHSEVFGICDRNSDFVVKLKFDITSNYCTALGFQSGSDNSGFDENDPYPTITRGFYFRHNSYLKHAVVMPPYFTINLWVKVERDGIIFDSSLIRLDSFGNMIKFKLTTESKVTYEISSYLEYGGWVYFFGIIEISTTAQSNFAFYLNSALADSGTTPDNSLISTQSEEIYLGSPETSFQGFLWLIKIYTILNSENSEFLTSGCPTSCTSCDSDYTCPTNCDQRASINDCNTNCPEACIYCYDSSYCDSCYPQAFRYGSECFCYSNSWNAVDNKCDCRDCYFTCQTCNSCFFQGCETCKPGYHLISTLCVHCPTGYIESEGSCIFSKSFVLDLKFDKILGVVYDSQSNLPAVTGESEQFYPNYEDNDPITAYGRGFYFNGASAIVRLPPNELDSRSVVLAPEFTFEIWFYSAEGVGSIYCKQETITLGSLFCLTLASNSILLSSYLSSDYYQEDFTLISSLNSSQWSYFSLGIYLSSYNFFEFEVQYNKDYFRNYLDNVIIDSSTGTLTIGGKVQSINNMEKTYSHYFKGFIYQVRLYSAGIPHPIASNSICPTNCLACNVETGSCFSNCNIETAFPSCESCGNCTNGCYDYSSNCELSGDGLCFNTSDFGVCAGCKDNAEFVDGNCECVVNAHRVAFECIICEKGFYFEGITCVKCQENCTNCNQTYCLECDIGYTYDEENDICTHCLDNCVKCNSLACLECESGYFLNDSKCDKCINGCQTCSETECFECESGFYLNYTDCQVCEDNCISCNLTDCLICDEYFEYKEGNCKCKEEYKGTHCDFNTVRLEIYVNFDNSLLLMFSNNVVITKNDLAIYFLNSTLKFSLNELNSSTYLVTVNFEENVKKDESLYIEFKDSFIQKNELKYSSIVILYSKTIKTADTDEKYYEKFYSFAIPLASIAVAAVSSLNPNPASLWSFISYVQLLTYLYMLKIPYSARTKGLLRGLRKYNMFPNLFDYFVETSGSDHEYTILIKNNKSY